jgi:hypothetical protein
MTQTKFGEQACHKFRAKLDSYIDDELLTESNLEMIEHFSRCNACTQEAQERRNVRRRLQKAVRDIPSPEGLEQRIRDGLRQPKQSHPKKLFLMAIAAGLALSFGVLRLHDSGGGLLRIAFDDHLHCAVIHHPVPRVPGMPNQLPAPFNGLAALVQERVPSEFALILAHQCQDQGRSFVHLTFGDGRHLLSLVITHKQSGESLGAGVGRAVQGRFQLAAFETDQFFVYTVSDLPAKANADLLVAFAPGLRVFLDKA